MWHQSHCSKWLVPFPCAAETLQDHTVVCRCDGEDGIHLGRGFSSTLRSGLILTVLSCLAFTEGGGWSISPSQFLRFLKQDTSIPCLAMRWGWSPYRTLRKDLPYSRKGRLASSGSHGHTAPTCSWSPCSSRGHCR